MKIDKAKPQLFLLLVPKTIFYIWSNIANFLRLKLIDF